MKTAVLFLILQFCFGDILHSETLKKMEARIMKLIVEPEFVDKDTIQKDLLDYYMKLDCLYDLMKEQDPRGKQIIEDIEEEGGPFLDKVKLDEKLLMETFDWTEDDVLELNATIRGINKLWKDIVLSITEVPTTIFDPDIYFKDQ